MFHDFTAFVRKNAQLIRFVVTGGSAALIFFALNYLGLRLGIRPFVASLAAYVCSFLFGYTVQRGWTFRGVHSHQAALPRYFIVQVGCGLFTSAASQGLASFLDVRPLILSGTATLLASGISYVASSLWVFPTGKARQGSRP